MQCFAQTTRGLYIGRASEFLLKLLETPVVEAATGRKVRAFLSESHVDPDISAEIFVLEPSGEGKAGVAQLDRLSERVAALRDGAFAPYSQQPMVRAVLVPALTYGATAGLQFLHIN